MCDFWDAQPLILGPKCAQNTIFAVIMAQERSQTHGDRIKIDRSNPFRHHVTIVTYPTLGIL